MGRNTSLALRSKRPTFVLLLCSLALGRTHSQELVAACGLYHGLPSLGVPHSRSQPQCFFSSFFELLRG
jgi:hypothetical protein